MFKPHSLLASQIVPTAASYLAGRPRLLRPSRTCVVTFARIGYAIRLTSGNWRNEDFHLARFAALSAAHTFSQAISRFFRLYTLSINEWTFLTPVRLIQSTSLLRRECTGFSLMELFLLLAFTHLAFSLFLTSSPAVLPRPLPSPVARSRGFHHAS